MGFRVNSAKSSQKKTKKKRAAPPPKKATAHKSIAQSGTIKPSLSCEGGHVHFFFHDWGKHNAGEEKKQSAKTIDSLGFLYVPPSVCEMSTKAEQCKYGGVFWVPVCAFFSPPVLSWWGREGGGGFASWKCDFFFFLFFWFGTKKEKKKAYEGELSLVMKPRYPWQVATRPLTAEDGSRGSEHTGSLRPHVFTCASVCFSGMMSGGDHSIPSSRCAFIYYFYSFPSDWRGCVRCVRGKKSEVCCWIQGRPGWEISLLENMVALDW